MKCSASVTVIPKGPAHQPDILVHISKPAFSQFQIEKKEKLRIAVGKNIVTVEVQEMEKTGAEIHIPENILKELYLPIKIYKFQAIYFADSHTLWLGPIIGLLTDFNENQENGPHFRSIHKFCEELHQGVSESGGLIYVFSFDSFTKVGYYFDSCKWTPAELPLPDVIYNRVHSRRLEQSRSFKKFRNKLINLTIPMFNDRFLSKWEVYQQVKLEHGLLPYLPETKVYSKENLFDLAQKYETVFIKPVNGSQGRNIIKLLKTAENIYSFQSSHSHPNLNNHINLSLDDFYQQIEPLLQNRIYLVQQGISFIANNAQAMDFRVLCHKNQHHQWKITSIVARVSAKDRFVSNLAKGGTILKPIKALRTIFNKQDTFESLRRMKELALKTAETVSSSASGITGELGIDIGVDQTGKPWLIEVNSKPSKEFEDGLNKIRPSAKAIIEFCTQLAFDITGERKYK